LIQIGFVKSKGLVNLYSILGVLVCVLAIVLIYTGIKKIGDYIFIKNDR
jgi:small neutral amino acid transporter SnatA (MarC family)